MTTLIQRLGWRSVAALTADGEEYTDYMASLQVGEAVERISFIVNVISGRLTRTLESQL